MDTYKTFETERLYLRPTQEEDADFILTLMNSPKWIQFIGERNVKSTEDAKAYIRTKMTPHLVKYGYANNTVIRKSDHQKIGTCGLYNREGVEGIDIGFAFLPQFEGMGYGTEAATCLMHAAYNQFGISTLKGICNKENEASKKLLIKLGFRFSGTTTLGDSPEELFLYKIDLAKAPFA